MTDNDADLADLAKTINLHARLAQDDAAQAVSQLPPEQRMTDLIGSPDAYHPHCTSMVDYKGDNIEALAALGRDVPDGEFTPCDYVDMTVSYIDNEPAGWHCPWCGGTRFEGVRRDAPAVERSDEARDLLAVLIAGGATPPGTWGPKQVTTVTPDKFQAAFFAYLTVQVAADEAADAAEESEVELHRDGGRTTRGDRCRQSWGGLRRQPHMLEALGLSFYPSENRRRSRTPSTVTTSMLTLERRESPA